ncbi:hypothetical protein [Chryseobacterium taichungense]|nr:hypothetical protein [Chryseobacterium taichungense]
MNTFSSLKEVLFALSREEKLLAEMFKRRKTAKYKYEYALELADDNDGRLQYLIERSVIRQNESTLEIDDLYVIFLNRF